MMDEDLDADELVLDQQRRVKRTPVGSNRSQTSNVSPSQPRATSSGGRHDDMSETPQSYRLVQITAPEIAHQAMVQPTTAQILTTNAQGDFITTSAQPLFLNASGNLSQESQQTKLAYVPAGAIAVTGNTSQALQLQTLEGSTNQYYIMLPPAGELIQTPSSSTIPSGTARVITAPRLQQAAFIPLSRFEPVRPARASALPVQSESSAGNKEIKRRVSHNEVEKRRRDKINNGITKLARVIPNGLDEQAKLSKGGILSQAAQYILELRKSNGALTDTLRQMESEMTLLKEENELLRQRLQSSGMTLPPPLSNVAAMPVMTASASATVPVPLVTTASVSSTTIPAAGMTVAPPPLTIPAGLRGAKKLVVTGKPAGAGQQQQHYVIIRAPDAAFLRTGPDEDDDDTDKDTHVIIN